MKINWKTDATRNGKPIRLYVATTDEIITKDLALDKGQSLTLIGRQENYRQGPTQETNHEDFAAGAFIAAAGRQLQLINGMSKVDAIPVELRPHDLGGGNRPYIIAVFEEVVAQESSP
jgi:hypothetical protein